MSFPGIRTARRQRDDALLAEPLDLLIIGGGISGAPVFSALAGAGYRVGLVDRGDFASGTSQASGMLIWGGLLYLKHGDLRTVRKLCLARNALLREPGVRPLQFRYRTAYAGAIPTWALRAGLWGYWMLGDRALRAPELLSAGTEEEAVAYEEAMLEESDCRLVLRMLMEHRSGHAIAQNHREVIAGRYDAAERLWRVTLRDRFTGAEMEVKCRMLINAAGGWTDALNEQLGIASPYRHVLSKGVYLNFCRRDAGTHAEIYPMPGASDVLTAVPWGPVTMWGPTETPVSDLEAGFIPEAEDVRYLMESARKLRGADLPEVISLRCGVRPLAVRRGVRVRGESLAISRRHYLACDAEKPSLAIYGGKLTGSRALGEEVLAMVRRWMEPRFLTMQRGLPEIVRLRHPAFEQPVVHPEWARDQEQCATLVDYLRRRTPIAQWVKRGGLGCNGEYRPLLTEWARVFSESDAGAEAAVSALEREVCQREADLFHSVL